MTENTKVAVRYLMVGDVAVLTNEKILAVQPCYARTQSRTRNTHRNVCLQNVETGKQRWTEWNAGTEILVAR